jgi:hypothetical protein
MELDDIQPVNNKPQQSAEQHMAKPETPFENIRTPHFPMKLFAGLCFALATHRAARTVTTISLVSLGKALRSQIG